MSQITPYNDARPKKEQVREMFDRIAPRYDLLNHILSCNIDRLWRRRLVRLVRDGKPRHILDVATGTGDSAIALARGIGEAHVTGVDISEGMLATARTKVANAALDTRITLMQQDAERLDFPDRAFDAVTVAFGVRNFAALEQGLAELVRTLRPGGKLFVLELSQPKGWFGRCYSWYATRMLPRIGGWLSHKQAYTYLPVSVEAFPAPERFTAMLEQAGLHDCTAKKLSFGIAHIFTGTR